MDGSKSKTFGPQEYPAPWCACGNARKPGSHMANECTLFDAEDY